MRIFWLLFLMVALNSNAAVKYYSDYPNNANPPSTYILSLETLDHSAGGIPYNYWTLAQMTEWLGHYGFTNGGTLIVSNVSFQFITNLYGYITNLYSTNINVDIITNNSFYTTNVTINLFGGVTNLNLAPSSLMKTDANDAEASVANGSGVLTNNGFGAFGWLSLPSVLGAYIGNNGGEGTNTMLWGVTVAEEIDTENLYVTNFFSGLTNAVLLSTDGDGFLQPTDFQAATNNDLTISNALYVQIQTGTNGSLIAATNNDTVVSNGVITYITGTAAPNYTNEVTRQINSGTNTVLIRYNTNSIPSSGVLTFGQAYFTNLQASVVLPAFTLNDSFYETLVICVTNSAAATTTLTMPSGVKVALANGGGNLIYCTNGTRTTVVIEHYGHILTNAWKNDF